MSTVRVPYGVSQVTLAVSGVLTPDANRQIYCTPQEATTLAYVQSYDPNGNCGLIATDPVTGNTLVQLPNVVTQITINGNSYNAVNGVISGVPGADFTAMAASAKNDGGAWQLVQG